MLDRMRHDSDGEPLLDSTLVAAQLGMSPAVLRVWRARHPALLPIAGYGKHGVALFRVSDVLDAAALTVRDGSVTSGSAG
jgi:hypothetical protein